MESLAMLIIGIVLFQHYYSFLVLGVTYENDYVRRVLYGERIC